MRNRNKNLTKEKKVQLGSSKAEEKNISVEKVATTTQTKDETEKEDVSVEMVATTVLTKKDETEKENVFVGEKKKSKMPLLQKIGLALAREAFEELAQEKCALEQQLNSYLQKNNEDQSKITQLEDEIDRLKKNLSDIEKKRQNEISRHDEQERKLLDEIGQKEREKEDLKEELQKSAKAEKNSNIEEQFFNKLTSRFAKLVEKNMTIDEAFNIISQKIAELERKCKDAALKIEEQENAIRKDRETAERKKADLEKQLKDAEEHIHQMESSEKGELLKQIENYKRQLEEKENSINTLQSDINQVKTVNEKLNEEKACLKSQLEESKEKYTKSKTSHTEEMAKLKDDHQKEISKLKNANLDDMKKMKAEHEEIVQKLTEKHNEEEEMLKKQYDQEKDALNSVHKEEMNNVQAGFEMVKKKLNDAIDGRNQTIQSLNEKLKSECHIIRHTSVEAVNNLFETLKANDVMAACSDDYIGKVEEKNQELLVGSKKLRNRINELPFVDTPSEWTALLSQIIYELLDDNSSVICKLLKYYALSNVPCMIDDKRDEGIYFIKKNISNAYNSLAVLLAQCYIAPIIPAIFVENVHEGEYEVEGSFNDVEAFCPGSINEHIEHIERDSDGLEGIIVGVTKVGYKSADGKVVKSKVLIK